MFLFCIVFFKLKSHIQSRCCSSRYLTLHERPLELLPPVLQGAAQPIPAGVHLLQAVPQLPRLLGLRLRLEEVGASQVDGEDLRLVVVQALLQLLKTGDQEEVDEYKKYKTIQTQYT